jgi:purine nucleosidase
MKSKYLLAILTLIPLFCFAQKQKVWLDADTGNEMDDLYAIARLVKESSVDLVGLSSAHFNNADLLVVEKWNAYPTKGFETCKESQRLNEQILKALNRLDIAHQDDLRDSPAARAIIAAAKALPDGQKLDVLTLGALSNIATAVILAPEILPKIRCFSLGAKYDPKTKVWNKSEFNIRNDLNAFDYLLNKEGFDLTIMPLEAALPLQFKREDTYARLDETLEIEKILADRWREHNPQDTMRVMWDLALVEAYLKPNLVKMVVAKTPPENKQRKVNVYVKIDVKTLTDDFWMVLKQK